MLKDTTAISQRMQNKTKQSGGAEATETKHEQRKATQRNPAPSNRTKAERHQTEQSRADQSRSVLHCHDLQATDAKFNGLAVTWPLRSPEAFAVAQIRAVAHCCPSTTLITASNGHHLPNRPLRPTMVGPNARVCSTRPARSRRPPFRFARSSWVLLSENTQQR